MAKLERYGLEWSGHKDFVAKPMPDGYWTPWHIAQAAVDAAILNWGGVAKSTRPTPPADAMIREHRDAIAELIKVAARMVTGEWLPSPFQEDHKRKVPRWILAVFDKLQQDACYNAQKIKKSVDVLRNALQSPAPVTDAHGAADSAARKALEEFPEGRNHGDLCRYLDKHEGTIRAALTSPAQAQVDVEKLKREIIAEWNAVLEADPQYKFHQPSPAQTIAIAIHYLCVKGHLTPKTQSEE